MIRTLAVIELSNDNEFFKDLLTEQISDFGYSEDESKSRWIVLPNVLCDDSVSLYRRKTEILYCAMFILNNDNIEEAVKTLYENLANVAKAYGIDKLEL